MKKTILTAAFSVMTVVAFAQKKEIRNAGKALDKGNYTEAKSLIDEAEGSISGAKSKVQSDFYYTKGLAYMGPERNNSYGDLMEAAEAFKKAQQLGNKDAGQGISMLASRLVNVAVQDQSSENYSNAAEKLLLAYSLENNPDYLFYAASNFVNAEDYENSLKYYQELRDMGYTGETTEYLATNTQTGQVESFSKEQRDLMVKTPQYNNPQERKTSSKTGEITRNIALIHIQNGDNDKALQAMKEAKKENPDDINLMMVEADMYSNLGENDKYKEIMEKITEKDPNNPTLFYNLGVSSAQMGDEESAIKYYSRAIELDPDMINARLNIAFSILAGEEALVTEMNSLGTSKAENEKYEALSKERKDLYRQALPHLQAASEIDPENIEVARTLMNIYYQLEENQKAEEMKKRIAQLQG